MMIAHSLRGETFGPAQRLHGATYVVDLELSRFELDADGIVADIGRVSTVLHEVLAPLNYRNLDEMAVFDGVNTTTERLARIIFDRVAEQILAGVLGPDNGGIDGIKVSLRESHIAWASHEGSLGSTA
jgi:6-pyruvoyl-tetrahydropterin synthase